MPAREGGVRWASQSAAAAPAEQFKWDALQVALAILVFMQVWRVQDLFPVLALFGLPILATCVTLLLFVLDRDPRRCLSNLNQPVVLATLGLLALVALSVPGSLYVAGSLDFLVKGYLRTVLLMLLVAGRIRGFADLRRLAWLQIAGVLLYSGAVTAQFPVGRNGRLQVLSFYDVNDLALLIISSLPLVLYLWRQPAGLVARMLLIAASVFLMTTLVKTGSRGGFVAFLAVAAYLLLRFRGVSGAKRAGAVALLAMLLVGTANSSYFERISTILHPSRDYNWSGGSEVGRMEIWKRGIGYMLSHPVFGVGARSFAVAEGELAPEARVQRYGRGFKWSEAHNAFIEIGAELGVLGLILFVTLLVSAFGLLSRIRRRATGEAPFLAQALIASLIGVVVASMFLSQAYSAYLYTLLGMSLGLARIASPVHRLAPRMARRSVPALHPVADTVSLLVDLVGDGR